MPGAWDRSSGRVPALAAALAIAALALHVLAYAWTVADPVVVSDAWHFIDLVVRPYATGDFGIGDLFVKRNALDHSQPLNKLVTIANYEWFDLDYRYEAMLGALSACASVGMLWAAWRRARGARGATPAEALALVAIAAVYLSIGASTAYSWPLVAMGFTTHPFVIGLAWAAWRAFATGGAGRMALLCAAAFATGVVADDVGLVAAMAISMATLVAGWRARRWRPALAVVLAIALSLGAYLLLYRLVSATPGHGASPSLASGLAALLARPGDWWSLLAPPLAASVAHRVVLADWFGAANAAAAAQAIAVVLLLAHAWFWSAALPRGARMNAVAHVAIALMLLFYGLLVALWLTRIAQFGADYLWQPRYAVLYRWNLVALLLMVLAQRMPGGATPAPRTSGIAGSATLALAALLLAVQLPLARASWREAPYIANYQAREARQVIGMAARGGEPPEACIATLVVCRFPDARRRQVIGFLQQQRLNVFDPEVREALGLAPGDTP